MSSDLVPHYLDRSTGKMIEERISYPKIQHGIVRSKSLQHILNTLFNRSWYCKLYGKLVDRAASKKNIQKFAQNFRIDLTEVEKSIDKYPNLNAFFSRKLKPGARPFVQDESVFCSPADGKVVEIIKESDSLLPNENYTRVSVFLNVFNVHVNRVPIAGKIEAVRYNKGKFLNAANHKASLDNEQNAILLDNGSTKVLVKQIAGLIARRIVCWAKEGDDYQLGQRFGLIRFGSRTDIFVPEGTTIKVKEGDIVSGGSSIIGYLK